MKLTPVDPAAPVAPYLGGKRALSHRLTTMIDATPHRLFVDVFMGMGGVFFRRRQRPRKEVINDINGEVMNLFRMMQRHPRQLLDTMALQLASREEFDRLKRSDPAQMTELDRAVRFVYLQRLAFGGMIHGQSFGVDRASSARFDLRKLMPSVMRAHQRLQGVDIERLPYEQLIARYDRPGALFYLDPPYHGCEGDYGPGVFSEADFDRLRGVLEAAKGRFIMSINDTPFIRETFAGFTIEEVGLNYRVSGKVTPARELIVSNGRA